MVVDLQRLPIPEWTANELVWTTQLGDLRRSRSLGESEDQQRLTILRELKMMALFQPRSLVRDTDVVNSLCFQRLVVDNELGFREAIQSGTVVIGIRDEFPNLSAVNDWIGEKRAYPDRLNASREFLKVIDSYLSDSSVVLASHSMKPNSVSFGELLDRVVVSGYLAGKSQEMLAQSLEYARGRSEEGFLRFGHIYDYLVRQRGVAPTHELIPWCRVAHALVVPVNHGLQVASNETDFSGEKVAYLAGTAEVPLDLPEPFDTALPKQILSLLTLDSLDFRQIVELRSLGGQCGYFEAMSEVHNLLSTGKYVTDTKAFCRKYVKYLEALDAYISSMRVQPKVELVDWQKLIGQRAWNTRMMWEVGLAFAVPVIVGATVVICSTIVNGQSPVSFNEIVKATGEVTAGAKVLLDVKRLARPEGLNRILKGPTTLPSRRK